MLFGLDLSILLLDGGVLAGEAREGLEDAGDARVDSVNVCREVGELTANLADFRTGFCELICHDLHQAVEVSARDRYLLAVVLVVRHLSS
ncbi:MAG: hypothetical protein ACKV22_34200 [Bryobacteraceae bacterium]